MGRFVFKRVIGFIQKFNEYFENERNSQGQLGTGFIGNVTDKPQLVMEDPLVKKVDGGYEHVSFLHFLFHFSKILLPFKGAYYEKRWISVRFRIKSERPNWPRRVYSKSF